MLGSQEVRENNENHKIKVESPRTPLRSSPKYSRSPSRERKRRSRYCSKSRSRTPYSYNKYKCRYSSSRSR